MPPFDPVITPTPDDTTDFLNPSLVVQAERLARRKAELLERAKAASMQIGVYAPAAATESPGFQSAVTGTHIVMPSASPGKFSKYAPLAQQLLNSIEQGSLDKDSSGFERLAAAAARRHLASKPPDTAPDADKLAWAQEGASIPSLKPVMEAYVNDQLTKAPERAEAREFRRSEAEATRQFRADEAQRQRDFQGQQGDANRSLRETIAQLMGSRDRYTSSQDGSVVVNARTGEARPTGIQSKDQQKQERAEEKTVTDSTNALDLIDRSRGYLGNATGSGAGALVDEAYRFFGKTNEGMKSGRALKQLSGQLTSLVPRFEGQQSNADVQYYKQQAADVGDETLTAAERAAALVEVERMHRTKIGLAGKGAKVGPVPSPREPDAPRAKSGAYKEPTISDSVRAAYGQQLTQEWNAAKTDGQRALIEQRMMSLGVPVPKAPASGGGAWKVEKVQ